MVFRKSTSDTGVSHIAGSYRCASQRSTDRTASTFNVRKITDTSEPKTGYAPQTSDTSVAVLNTVSGCFDGSGAETNCRCAATNCNATSDDDISDTGGRHTDGNNSSHRSYAKSDSPNCAPDAVAAAGPPVLPGQGISTGCSLPAQVGVVEGITPRVGVFVGASPFYGVGLGESRSPDAIAGFNGSGLG